MKATRGQHWFDPSKFHGCGGEANRLYKKTVATCTYLTICGNYVLIVWSRTWFIRFTNCSCLFSVGLAVNNVNRVTVTVGGSEVRFWSFNEHKLIGQLDLPSTSLLVRFHADSDVLATALSNAAIILIDVLHRQIIRTFVNSEVQLCVDMDFSYDGRWLVSAHHGDPLIKTWDIVDSKLIDCFRVELPITSIALSRMNEFLATTHANCLGIYLWDNRATYKCLHLQPLPIDYVPGENRSPVSLPTRVMMTRNTSDEIELGMLTEENEFMQQEDTDGPSTEESTEHVYISPEQLHGHLLTLSGVPSSYFTTLLNLNFIRERNRQAARYYLNTGSTIDGTSSVANSKNLPFFLPVVETNKGLVWAEDDDAESLTKQLIGKKSNKPRGLLDKDFAYAMEPIRDLSAKLIRAKSNKEFDQITHILKSVGPNALDLEICMLIPSAEDEAVCSDNPQTTTKLYGHLASSYEKLHGFLRFLINRFQSNRDVDFACVCLEILLHRHNDILFRHSRNQHNAHNTKLYHDETVGQCLLANDNRIEEDEDLGSSSPSSYSTTLNLIKQAIKSKEKSQVELTNRVTQSLCLVDFIRNPVTALQL
ncbi:unnamed protein product [Heterobilharzia americana]|nr:unnamed protein product [Heterobilharzia americana]